MAKKTTKKKAAAKSPTATRKKTAQPKVAKVSPDKGKSVEAYIAGLSGWQADMVAELHKLILAAAPTCTSGIKWGQPVYEQNGPFAYMKAFGKHVNFGFWRGAELPDPKSRLEGSGEKMRHVKVTSPDDVDAAALKALIKAAVKLNQAKGDPTKTGGC